MVLGKRVDPCHEILSTPKYIFTQADDAHEIV